MVFIFKFKVKILSLYLSFTKTTRIPKWLHLLQVDLSQVLKSEQSELQCMWSHSDRACDEVSRSTCFALMGLNHIINSRGKLKMIDISCVGSGVKYHSLSNLSIIIRIFDR